MKENTKERRQYPRVQLNMLVQFRVDSYKQFLEEYALDISTGGMFIRTNDPRPIGSIIFFQFAIKDQVKCIEGQAKVVHINPVGGNVPAGMGLEFISLDANSRQVIDKIVNDRIRDTLA